MDPNGSRFSGTRATKAFKRDLKRAPPNIRQAARTAIEDLIAGRSAGKHRMHSLGGYYPTIYKIDVFSNRSWQISFNIDGAVLVLRRLAPHRVMDRSP